MARTRRKPQFKCHKCKKNLGSARASYDHFQDNPSHRNKKQKTDYLKNKADVAAGRDRGGSILPTRRRGAVRRDRVQKFCTSCGNHRLPSHEYCGGCGSKL